MACQRMLRFFNRGGGFIAEAYPSLKNIAIKEKMKMDEKKFRSRVRAVTALGFAAVYLLMAGLLTTQKARIYEERLNADLRDGFLHNVTNRILLREQFDGDFTHAESMQWLASGMVDYSVMAQYALSGTGRDFVYSVAQYYDENKRPVFNTVCMLSYRGEYGLEYISLQTEPDYDTLRAIYGQRPANYKNSSYCFVNASVQGFRTPGGFIMPQAVTIGGLELTYDYQPGPEDVPFDTSEWDDEWETALYLPLKRTPSRKDVQRLQELCDLSANKISETTNTGIYGSGIWKYECWHTGTDPFERSAGPYGYYTTAALAFPLRGAAYYMLRSFSYLFLFLCVAFIRAVTVSLIVNKKEALKKDS